MKIRTVRLRKKTRSQDQVRETKGSEGYTVSYSPSNISQLDGDSKLKDITVTNTKKEEKKEEKKETEKPSGNTTPGREDRKRNIPNTADSFHRYFWLIALLGSMLSGLLTAITLRRYS